MVVVGVASFGLATKVAELVASVQWVAPVVGPDHHAHCLHLDHRTTSVLTAREPHQFKVL